MHICQLKMQERKGPGLWLILAHLAHPTLALLHWQNLRKIICHLDQILDLLVKLIVLQDTVSVNLGTSTVLKLFLNTVNLGRVFQNTVNLGMSTVLNSNSGSVLKNKQRHNNKHSVDFYSSAFTISATHSR